MNWRQRERLKPFSFISFIISPSRVFLWGLKYWKIIQILTDEMLKILFKHSILYCYSTPTVKLMKFIWLWIFHLKIKSTVIWNRNDNHILMKLKQSAIYSQKYFFSLIWKCEKKNNDINEGSSLWIMKEPSKTLLWIYVSKGTIYSLLFIGKLFTWIMKNKIWRRL